MLASVMFAQHQTLITTKCDTNVGRQQQGENMNKNIDCKNPLAVAVQKSLSMSIRAPKCMLHSLKHLLFHMRFYANSIGAARRATEFKNVTCHFAFSTHDSWHWFTRKYRARASSVNTRTRTHGWFTI